MSARKRKLYMKQSSSEPLTPYARKKISYVQRRNACVEILNDSSTINNNDNLIQDFIDWDGFEPEILCQEINNDDSIVLTSSVESSSDTDDSSELLTESDVEDDEENPFLTDDDIMLTDVSESEENEDEHRSMPIPETEYNINNCDQKIHDGCSVKDAMFLILCFFMRHMGCTGRFTAVDHKYFRTCH